MKGKKILLHTCCAPCLSSSNERLQVDGFMPIIFWYNPNIEPREEHDKRLHTLYEFLKESAAHQNIIFEYDYETENKLWHRYINGCENEREGGRRCEKCIEFRLQKTASKAKELALSFSTTLTVSPHKNSKQIFESGQKIGNDLEIPFLAKDFKKNDGYKRSVELSKEYDLYRQNYCGCRYSRV